MINNKKVAKRYAKAFLHEKADKDKFALMADEIKIIAESIESHDEFKEFFESPLNTREVKINVVRNMSKQLEVSSYSLLLLELLIKKNRMSIMSLIADELQSISDEINGRVRVSMTTAYEPSVSEIEDISKNISAYFKREVIVFRKIDPSIIGGFILESEGKLIDMSIKGQIRKLLTKV